MKFYNTTGHKLRFELQEWHEAEPYGPVEPEIPNRLAYAVQLQKLPLGTEPTPLPEHFTTGGEPDQHPVEKKEGKSRKGKGGKKDEPVGPDSAVSEELLALVAEHFPDELEKLKVKLPQMPAEDAVQLLTDVRAAITDGANEKANS